MTGPPKRLAGRNLTIGVLYPDLLNIYADRGNLMFLKARCDWRGITAAIRGIGIGEALDPANVDLVYIGGGQDRDQAICAEDMAHHKADSLAECVESSIPVLAVCGGYQLLGRGYDADTGRLPGAAVAGFDTVRSDGPRLVGPCAIQTDLGGPTGGLIAGFENHAGRTVLDDPLTALGTVISGHGNDGRDGLEGYRRGNLIGTYLHGPLLPKNWWLADWLIAAALDVDPGELPELDDTFERSAHLEALSAAGARRDGNRIE